MPYDFQDLCCYLGSAGFFVKSRLQNTRSDGDSSFMLIAKGHEAEIGEVRCLWQVQNMPNQLAQGDKVRVIFWFAYEWMTLPETKGNKSARTKAQQSDDQ